MTKHKITGKVFSTDVLISRTGKSNQSNLIHVVRLLIKISTVVVGLCKSALSVSKPKQLQ